jgi:glucosylceramidase
MNFKIKIYSFAVLAFLTYHSATAQQKDEVGFWLTNPDKSALFEKQNLSPQSDDAHRWGPSLDIDDGQKFQAIDGFGFALTGGSAMLITHMSAGKRAALLKELFATDSNNIGISYLRISIGSSDMNDHVFSYDDLPEDKTDVEMAKFSLDPDRADVIPVLKEILAINPDIKILGSPWSAPAWMKTNNNCKGGMLKPQYYAAYAKYFVKYVQGMKAEGIRIDAITVQNEPLHDGNTPSMLMFVPEQASFIKNYLGPAFIAAGIDTKIILYDHNCDVPEYPIAILNDPEVAKYVDGSGFHLYNGNIEALTTVHNAHPDKNLYFTEQMVIEPASEPTINIGVPVRRLIMGATRNWSRNVILWNLAADPNNKPHTDNGGCPMCQGAITIDGNEVSRNIAYYAIAHASKFIRPGSYRIGSNDMDGFPNVAFKTPGGKIVVIVLNSGWSSQTIRIRYHGRLITTASMKGGAVGTFVFNYEK